MEQFYNALDDKIGYVLLFLMLLLSSFIFDHVVPYRDSKNKYVSGD